MTLKELIPACEIVESKGNLDLPLTRLSKDSSNCNNSDVFFALKGTRVDGHLFISHLVAQGVTSFVVEDETALRQVTNGVRVRSTRNAWARAASRWFKNPSEKLSLVGITGTNGKTTSTFLLRDIWIGNALNNGLIGTVRSYIGEKSFVSELTTPDAYDLQSTLSEMVDARVTHVSMEVSSIALDQCRVVGTTFDVGLFTNLTQDHLDYHKDFKSYFAAKMKLFRDFGLSKSVVNLDDPYGKQLMLDAPTPIQVRYSLEDRRADICAESVRFTKDGTTAVLHTPHGKLDLKLRLIGRHNLYNALGVIGVAYAQGLSIEKAVAALAHSAGAPGRLERPVFDDKFPKVFVDYAHTDDALLNVLNALRAVRGDGPGKIITVFGCGGDRDRTKRPKMASVASRLSDITIATSDNPRTEDPQVILSEVEKGIVNGSTEYHRESDRKKAIELALSLSSPEDMVLIAGKGHEDYQIIGRTKIPFDDKKVVQEYYFNKC